MTTHENVDDNQHEMHGKADESYAPMQMIREMLQLAEAKKPSLKKAARSVYHRDYMKTRNKPYRKYDPKKYEQSKGE